MPSLADPAPTLDRLLHWLYGVEHKSTLSNHRSVAGSNIPRGRRGQVMFIAEASHVPRELARNPVGCRSLLRFTGVGVFFRAVPLWDVFTPDTAPIFVNNSTEKLGAL
jgi:hypothetical protein